MRQVLAVFVLIALFVTGAIAQVRQSGPVTPGHPVMWTTSGVISDGGPSSRGNLTGLGVTTSGPGICQNSGPVTGPYNQICMGATATGGGQISINNFAGASGGLAFFVNGVAQALPTISLPVVANDVACFQNSTGTLFDCGAFPPAGIVSIGGMAGPAILCGSNITCSGNTISATGGGGGGGVNAGTVNQLAWYAATGSTVSGLSSAGNGVLVTSAGSVPSISSTLPAAVQANITQTGGLTSYAGAAPTNGQIPIGGASGLVLATLTAGSGIGLTNGNSSVTIANSGVTSLGGLTGAITCGTNVTCSAGTISATGGGGGVAVVNNYITGFQLSNGSPAASKVNVAAGYASDSTNVLMVTATSKTVDFTTTGAGALDTGTVAASSAYAILMISNNTGSLVNALATKETAGSAISPTLPGGYTLYRYVGTVLTDGSANILAFSQTGNIFLRAAAVTADLSTSSPATSQTLVTLTVPLGFSVFPVMQADVNAAASRYQLSLWSPLASSGQAIIVDTQSTSDAFQTIDQLPSDTSGRIYYSGASASATVTLKTIGWVDPLLAPGGGSATGGGGGGSGTILTGLTGNLPYYASNGTTLSPNASINVSAGAITLGISGSVLGCVQLAGNGSGQANICAASTAGTPTIMTPTASGTMAVAASAPLALNSAGTISMAGVVGTVLAGVTPTFTATPTLGVAGTTAGSIVLQNGGAGGQGVTIQNNATTAAWNLNLPASAGNSGQPLLSGGGGASPMTFGTLGVSGGGTGLIAGTSGGILGFTGALSLASSPLLTANAPIVGGGVGATPISGSRSGNTTLFMSGSGAFVNNNCAKFDASGNIVDSGAACGASSTITVFNAQTLGVATAFSNAASAGGGIVYFPAGTYTVSNQNIPSNVTVLCAGIGATTITAGGPTVDIFDIPFPNDNITIMHCGFKSSGTPNSSQTSGYFINVQTGLNIHLNDLYMNGPYRGIRFIPAAGLVDNVMMVNLTRRTVSAGSAGLVIDSGCGDCHVHNFQILATADAQSLWPDYGILMQSTSLAGAPALTIDQFSTLNCNVGIALLPSGTGAVFLKASNGWLDTTGAAGALLQPQSAGGVIGQAEFSTMHFAPKGGTGLSADTSTHGGSIFNFIVTGSNFFNYTNATGVGLQMLGSGIVNAAISGNIIGEPSFNFIIGVQIQNNASNIIINGNHTYSTGGTSIICTAGSSAVIATSNLLHGGAATNLCGGTFANNI